MPAPCPSAEQLQALLKGNLPEAEQETLAQHLELCADCQRRLEAMTGGLTQSLQQARRASPPLSPHLEEAMQKLQGDTVHLAKASADPVLTIGTALHYFGDYEILEEVGRGGMGVVYKARQVSLNRTVALKLILAGQLASATEVRRFRTEAEAAAKLDHPHIVPIYEIGEHEGRHYFSMKLVEGGALSERSSEFRVPSSELSSASSDPKPGTRNPKLRTRNSKLATLVAALARAVHYAHQRGVLHRDLKPSNILLDAQGQPHLTDFGLAKILEHDSGLTHSGAIMGTPNYLAPEVAAGKAKEVTVSADVFSLGAILYELLTGRPPFQEETVAATLQKVLHAEPPPLRSLNPAVPRDLEIICLKCLEKEPSKRYITAHDLAEELGRFLNDQPILARPTGPTERIWRWCKRKPALAGTGAALLGVAVVGLAGILWQWDRAEVARRDAEAISTFLTAMFQSPDPARDGRTITVAETLGTAAKRIEADLTLQPERRAKLQATLGETYHSLGLDRDAIPLQEKVLDYCRATSGPEHSETMKAIQDLALSYYWANRRDEALKLREEVLTLRRKVNGANHPDTLLAMNHLTASYYNAGRRVEALKLAEKALPLELKVLGPEHSVTLWAMQGLANCYADAGRRDEALKLREQALPLCRKVNGAEHTDTIAAMYGLAASYHDVGRRDEALKLREHVLALDRKINGPAHPRTITTMQGLALSYHDAGRRDEALKLQEEALSLKLANARKSGTNNPGELELRLADLAELLYRQKQFETAELLNRERLQSRLRRAGAEGSDTVLSTTAFLGRLLSDWAWAERGTNVSSAYDRAREGEKLLRDAFTARARQTNTPAWRMADLQSRLGGALCVMAFTDTTLSSGACQSKLVEAETLLLKSHEALQAKGVEKQYRRDALERLVRLYEAWEEVEPNTGKTEQTAQWKHKLRDLDKSPVETSSPR